MIETSRRSLLGLMLAACAAPAIVRVSSLMPIKMLPTVKVSNWEALMADLTEWEITSDYGGMYAETGKVLRPTWLQRPPKVVAGNVVVDQRLVGEHYQWMGSGKPRALYVQRNPEIVLATPLRRLSLSTIT